jgi:hypothetical protein
MERGVQAVTGRTAGKVVAAVAAHLKACGVADPDEQARLAIAHLIDAAVNSPHLPEPVVRALMTLA